MTVGAGRRDDSGAAMVWTLTLLAVLITVTTFVSAVVVQAVARQRVAAVADVAALAGVQSLADPCSAAAASARANDANLESCEFDGRDILVTVTRPSPEFVAHVLSVLGQRAGGVSSSARAGPS